MKTERIFLGIDTSNYTTSLCILSESGKVIKNIKCPLPVKAGEVGLRQSDAVFSHVKNIPEAFSMSEGIIADSELLCVGVSNRPRDVEGSYMPCFLAGVASATSVCRSMGVPMYTCSHQSGHIMAAMYSSGMTKKYSGERFVAFHVSGGTTEMLLCKVDDDRVDACLIGQTLDLNAGQAVDRCGVMLGLGFPCGAELERLALGYYAEHDRIGGFGVSIKGCDCCLSGLENLAKKAYADTNDPGYVAAFVLEYIAKVLIKMSVAAEREYGKMPMLYAGGVMSNSIIKERIREKFPNAYFASPEYSSDNAVGVALLSRIAYLADTEKNKHS